MTPSLVDVRVRGYKKDDAAMIIGWWGTEPTPLPDMLLENGTFILEVNSIPHYSLTCYLTQSKEMAYLENFCRNPEEAPSIRLARFLVDTTCTWAKKQGYKRVICFSYRERLSQRYEALGMTRTMNQISSFVRIL